MYWRRRCTSKFIYFLISSWVYFWSLKGKAKFRHKIRQIWDYINSPFNSFKAKCGGKCFYNFHACFYSILILYNIWKLLNNIIHTFSNFYFFRIVVKYPKLRWSLLGQRFGIFIGFQLYNLSQLIDERLIFLMVLTA